MRGMQRDKDLWKLATPRQAPRCRAAAAPRMMMAGAALGEQRRCHPGAMQDFSQLVRCWPTRWRMHTQLRHGLGACNLCCRASTHPALCRLCSPAPAEACSIGGVCQGGRSGSQQSSGLCRLVGWPRGRNGRTTTALTNHWLLVKQRTAHAVPRALQPGCCTCTHPASLPTISRQIVIVPAARAGRRLGPRLRAPALEAGGVLQQGHGSSERQQRSGQNPRVGCTARGGAAAVFGRPTAG